MLGVGTTFAGYRIDGVLGRGGMGTVYLARHPRLPRSVALKLLNRDISTDSELVRRFEREADVIARLEHPGIIGVLDRGTDDGHLWIAMQYIRGSDAAALDPRAHPAATAVRLLGETAAALDYAHSRGVLHRDVKPANILIAEADAFRESHAILTDFGIARLTDPTSSKVTTTGTFTATLSYGSPEQLSGEAVDHRSDQYSLACTLFAILAGQPPYVATNPGQVVMGHLTRPVPRLTATRPDLPAAIDTVLERAMAKQRVDRFASCSEFTTAARDALEGRHNAADITQSAPPAMHAASPAVVHSPARHAPDSSPYGHPIPGGAAPDRQPVQPVWASPGPEVAPRSHPASYPPRATQTPEPLGPEPSAATALTAALITLLFALSGTVGFLIGCVAGLRSIAASSPYVASIAVILLTGGVSVLLWNSAWLLLLSGRRAGRLLTIACSGLGAIMCVLVPAATPFIPFSVVPEPAVDLVLRLSPILFVASAVSATALVCAAHGATRRWIAYRTGLRNAARPR